MIKIFSFQEQVAMAKEYEDKLLEYWNTLPEVVKVIDVRDEKEYRDMDIDFIHVRLDGKYLKARTIELKADTKIHKTGNVYVEPNGWLKKTRAEVIAYLDTVNYICYYIKTDKLRRVVNKRDANWRKVSVCTKDFGGYCEEGLLIPYEEIVKVSPHYEDYSKVFN